MYYIEDLILRARLDEHGHKYDVDRRKAELIKRIRENENKGDL